MVSPSTMKAVRESGAITNAEYVLEVGEVRKEFPGVLALDNVQFKLRPGTVHALMGDENHRRNLYSRFRHFQIAWR
jgi:inositol transport system ATP-binding protein